MNRSLFFFITIFSSYSLWAKPPILSEKQLLSPPPRIIRTCCAFGADVKVAGIPFMKVSDITAIDRLGQHTFLGSELENNGIVYTQKGGFIDIGHLRDQADWTAFLYSRLSQISDLPLVLTLGKEGGTKDLEIEPAHDLPTKDQYLLAAKIAYDLSVWHEIATFYGASYIPLVPERYSAFSMEDAYSNLLGVQIGMAALADELPFEQAVDKYLKQKLIELEVVATEQDTRKAMEYVNGNWWTDEAKLPSKKILIKREFEIVDCLKPWLVPEMSASTDDGEQICVPQQSSSGVPLVDLYELRIKLNHKFPARKLMGKEANRYITNKDFDLLITEAIRKNQIKNSPKLKAKRDVTAR